MATGNRGRPPFSMASIKHCQLYQLVPTESDDQETNHNSGARRKELLHSAPALLDSPSCQRELTVPHMARHSDPNIGSSYFSDTSTKDGSSCLLTAICEPPLDGSNSMDNFIAVQESHDSIHAPAVSISDDHDSVRGLTCVVPVIVREDVDLCENNTCRISDGNQSNQWNGGNSSKKKDNLLVKLNTERKSARDLLLLDPTPERSFLSPSWQSSERSVMFSTMDDPVSTGPLSRMNSITSFSGVGEGCPRPPTHLRLSVVSSFFCPVMGLLAICSSLRSKSEYKKGDYSGAWRDSDCAKKLGIAGIAVAIFLLAMIGVLNLILKLVVPDVH